MLRALRRALPLSRRKLAARAPGPGPWRLEEQQTYVVEYTPHYLVVPELHAQICASLALGGANCQRSKFVAMLRDPAARAFSGGRRPRRASRGRHL